MRQAHQPHAPAAPPPAAGRWARLDSPLPDPLEIGSGTALLLRGTIESGGPLPPPTAVRLGGVEKPIDGLAPDVAGARLWWTLLPVRSSADLRESNAGARLVVATGRETVELPLATTRIERDGGARSGGDDGDTSRIAISMATYEPDEAAFEQQIDSIRSQHRKDWTCLISDDRSSPEAYATIERTVAGDPRFRVERAAERGGFYRNFERALSMVPPGAELVALADQDDRWHPDKLDVLADRLAATPAATLAYSDMRIVAADGEVISDTFWYQSINSYEDIATLAVVNTVTGAASMFRRELLDLALPFPPAFSDQHYHDHWLALCAIATGEITYVDRPTYDYTRGEASVTIRASSHWVRPPGTRLEAMDQRARHLGRRVGKALGPGAWRAAYLDRFLLIRQYAMVLEERAGPRIEPRKRRRLRLLADADRSPRAALFLLARASRSLIGRRETLGRERVLLGGLVWRWTAATRSRVRGAGR